jgi:hypothetical protein
MKRIKYISKFNNEMTAEEIHILAEESAKNNAEKDITGILMTSGRIFFQIIEGPKTEIDILWDTITRDYRHTDIIVLKEETGSFDRLFPDWSMKGMALDAESEIRLEPLKVIMEMIVEWENRKEKLINTLELSIISEMSQIEKNI